MKKNFVFPIRLVILTAFVSYSLGTWAQHYKVSRIEAKRVEITSAFDNKPDEKAALILEPYKLKVDTMMNHVIGVSNCSMSSARPESLLTNWVADMLLNESEKYVGFKPDVAVINVGGLRTTMPKGNVTKEDIYEIAPFENALCVVVLTGDELTQLFRQIARLGGEGISGAQLAIDKEGKLLGALVGTEDVDVDKRYKVATVDYLAEGNDGLKAFALSNERIKPDNATLRQMLLNYVESLTKQGKHIDSTLDGRIRIK